MFLSFKYLMIGHLIWICILVAGLCNVGVSDSHTGADLFAPLTLPVHKPSMNDSEAEGE